MIYQVTGSNGFIGKHLCNYLESNGNEVIKIKRDLSNVKNEGTIIHLAAYGNHSNQTDLNEMLNANIHMLVKLISKTKKCERFINVSTSSVTLKNQTGYSLTKALGELIINGKDKRYSNVRPYSVFGEGEADFRLIPTIIRCLKTGENMQLVTDATHDYIHVSDFIKAMLGGYKEIGSGIKTTNLEIVRILEKISGKELKFVEVKGLRPYDNNNWYSLNPVPTMPLFHALRQTYEYYTK
jgi:nucleoside-diphosphate-sugar epimerase